jgi:hypothetical protein
MHDSDTSDRARGGDPLRLELDQLRLQLDRCQRDLHQARVELAQARGIQEALEERLRAGDATDHLPAAPSVQRHSVPWRRRWWRSMTMSATGRALQRDVQLLHQSDLFDPEWYLTEYPDIARSSMDPAEHYLRFGAYEGRDPGPLFSTDAYRRDHPEAERSGINPLVHFLNSRPGAGA